MLPERCVSYYVSTVSPSISHEVVGPDYFQIVVSDTEEHIKFNIH